MQRFAAFFEQWDKHNTLVICEHILVFRSPLKSLFTVRVWNFFAVVITGCFKRCSKWPPQFKKHEKIRWKSLQSRPRKLKWTRPAIQIAQFLLKALQFYFSSAIITAVSVRELFNARHGIYVKSVSFTSSRARRMDLDRQPRFRSESERRATRISVSAAYGVILLTTIFVLSFRAITRKLDGCRVKTGRLPKSNYSYSYYWSIWHLSPTTSRIR